MQVAVHGVVGIVVLGGGPGNGNLLMASIYMRIYFLWAAAESNLIHHCSQSPLLMCPYAGLCLYTN